MAYNVFLSFAMEDINLVTMFRGQAGSGRNDLEFRDYSIKEAFDSAWKSNCERIINMCSVLVCLVSRNTWKSDAVNWEIRKAAQLGKGVMAVYIETDVYLLPQALYDLRVEPVPWKMDAIMAELQAVAG